MKEKIPMEYICLQKASAEITEKKSVFIADIFPITTESEALECIASVQKKHRDARHHCYAYISADKSISRYSDDGEPAQTAGKPMMEVLRGRELVGICAVVTRYFGGILLGTGGLSRAYKDALLAGLADMAAAELKSGFSLLWELPYDAYGKMMFQAEKVNACIENAVFGQEVQLQMILEEKYAEDLIRTVYEDSSGKLSPIRTEKIRFAIEKNKLIKKYHFPIDNLITN